MIHRMISSGLVLLALVGVSLLGCQSTGPVPADGDNLEPSGRQGTASPADSNSHLKPHSHCPDNPPPGHPVIPAKATKPQDESAQPAEPAVEKPQNHPAVESPPKNTPAPPEKTGLGEAIADRKGFIKQVFFEQLRQLAAIWNRTKGRDRAGAQAGVMLKDLGERYYNILLVSLSHPEAKYRSMVSLPLAMTGKEDARENIIKAFKSEKDKSVRGDLLLSLSLLADADFPPDILKTVFEDEDSDYASRAAYLVFFILSKDKKSRFADKFSKMQGGDLLVKMLAREDEKGLARGNAIVALGKYPTRAGIDALVELGAASGENSKLESLICRTLGKMLGQSFPTAAQWKEWRDANLQYLRWDAKKRKFELDEQAKKDGIPVKPSPEEYR